MSRLTRWWSGRGTAAKVELYTRWTFHFFALIEIGAIGLVPLARAEETRIAAPLALTLTLLVCAHAVLTAVLSSRALDWALDRRDQPVRLATALTVLTAVITLAVLALRATGVLADVAVTSAVATGLVTFALGALVLCLRRPRRMMYGVPAAAIGTGGAVVAMGGHPGEGTGYAVGILLGGAGIVAACGFSAWLMKMVWELERSRDLKARLAVAEERLRFGRDLHDVMGRNLSVIALKSELAVQLARRERPEAVDQMIEVQRIAQESQREVRDVVRGYREADLRVELEGARGVLGAAGIDCAIDPVSMELPTGVQSVLGWVVRETTTNVLRHGDARRCAISLREKDGSVLLTVRNDGVREGAVMERGSGLAGLRERLAAVDGTLEAGPDDGGTFRVTALVPVPRSEKGAGA
ncbi:sensor histidine kinase [Streptomyces sp. NPDC014870]|uniref:sensor histidine kinase n=1 Tax=Streptomyces sp. NPDC014870 TaxID=3364925 RepID=UPI0036F809F4